MADIVTTFDYISLATCGFNKLEEATSEPAAPEGFEIAEEPSRPDTEE